MLLFQCCLHTDVHAQLFTCVHHVVNFWHVWERLWQRKEKNDSSNCEGKNMFKWTDDEAELLMCDYKVLKAAEGRLGIYRALNSHSFCMSLTH